MDYSQKSFNETIERLSKSPAETRGDILKIAGEYLENIGKKEVIPKIEQRMADYGYPLKLNKINSLDWYPVVMEMAIFFALFEILNWGEKDVKEFGKSFVKLSFIGRIIIKYYLSTEKTINYAAKAWRRQMDSGELEVTEINIPKGYIILKLKNFDLHPLYCVFLSGIFEAMSNFLPRAKGRKILAEERECTFRNGACHEFFIHYANP